jgi:endoglucanase
MPQGINYEVNPDLAGKTSLELMDMLMQGASDRGLKVILDRHRPRFNCSIGAVVHGRRAGGPLAC